MREVLSIKCGNEGGPPLLSTGAERIVAGIGRYVGCETNVSQFRFLPQPIDDLAYQVPPNTESRENFLLESTEFQPVSQA